MIIKKHLLSIVVPCYNEEDTIKLFLAEAHRVELQLGNQLDFEYIFINDGSKDNTLNVLKEISNYNSNVHYLSFSRNFGKESAMLAGLEHARGDFITVMDADLQDPPELLIAMYDKIQEGYDVVGTRRKNREGEPPIRTFFSKLFYKVINIISDTKIVDGARDYRLMTKQVVDSILEMGEVNRFSKGIFAWVGYDTYYIPYENRERVAGESSWNFWQLVRYSLEGYINFSEALLSIATYSGILSFIASIFGILFVVIRKLTVGGSVNGWASMIVVILFIGGLQLLCLGILGKYVAKIFLETKKRPVYIVKETDLYTDL
ncbi:glycosyltransferase family 2 protein [Streptococcus parauberis]|uniref:Putative bactoprenol glucosyl transferase-like protein n=1 Tax=Streptococcus parauberis NCFD 2020 TaxID=873447 RepID=F1YZB5_9STRE|nr:glycosyltransferase family 2 protein [Streptococcus parauberis]EGE53629.1 putative bactoprenol glucosyl transferase-like protein [Streptococcus parauberis NCFD 2020]PNY22586.1 putative glycosyltransferase CsbB [Streptococcus parauberis]RFE02080.1 putative glycosyltransferase CsbB [Streptococcus parauberis]UWM91624.1 glycosyltransferase family 2 protein [Streptococcus parauberis]GAJ60856.1 glycosyl transferase family protein [Streptococcus parauberis]